MTETSLLAEQTVIGSMLIDAGCIDTVAGMLTRQEFEVELLSSAFDLILSMQSQGQTVDPVTVLQAAGERGIGLSRAYVMELMEVTPTAANVEEYCKVVRESARLRALGSLAQNIQDAISANAPADKILQAITRSVESADSAAAQSGTYTPLEAMLAFWDHLGRRQSGEAMICTTGIASLDNTLGGGLLNSGLYILAARPGMGKTSVALNIADNVARNVGPVLFVSLEMGVEQLQAKRLARLTGMDSERILMASDVTQEEMSALESAGSRLQDLPVEVSRAASATTGSISALARRIKGLRLIVVDYMGKISVPGKYSRYEEYTKVSGELKIIARQFNVPVLCLAQLNRANEGRQDKRPALSDLRDTGAVEQDADGVVFLYREDYYEETPGNQDQTSITELIVAKNRHGKTGTCKVAFDKPHCKILPYYGSSADYYAKGKQAKGKRSSEAKLEELPQSEPVPFEQPDPAYGQQKIK